VFRNNSLLTIFYTIGFPNFSVTCIIYFSILFLETALKELKEAEKRQKQLEKKDKKVCKLELFKNVIHLYT